MGSHPLLMVDVKVYYNQQELFHPFANGGRQSQTTVNEYGFKLFANGGCQSLRQSTKMGSHHLLLVDVKVYYSLREWVHTLC